MVRTRGIGVHTRAATHGFKSAENLNGISVVTGLSHRNNLISGGLKCVAMPRLISILNVKEVEDGGKMAFESDKSVISALFYRLSTGAVIIESLAVVEHFIARLLQ